MGGDGINVNQAPENFYRPEYPPAAPPSVSCETFKPLPCRCGREPDWVLDGSIFGCDSCLVSGTSVAKWNALIKHHRILRGDVMDENERSEFEAWAAPKGMHLAQAESGLYVSRVTQNYIECWMASQACQAAKVQAQLDALSAARPYVAFALSGGMDGSHEVGLQLDAAFTKDASN